MTAARFNRPPVTDAETVRQWAVYERKGRRARLQYKALPISLGAPGTCHLCACGRRTIHETCRTCLAAAARDLLTEALQEEYGAAVGFCACGKRTTSRYGTCRACARGAS